MTRVFMFPGQSSFYPGMLHKLVELHPANGDLLAAASDFLSRDLEAHFHADNPQAFAKNRDVQVGVFLANQMFLEILKSAGIEAQLSLGLSLGEWNHLVHIGAVSFNDALRAVERRGCAYDAGATGLMAAVFPMSVDELTEIAERASAAGVVEVVNLNSPRQQVLAGDGAGVRRAVEIIEAETVCRAVVLDVELPMHCSTFESVSVEFKGCLETLEFSQPRLPYIPNRLGRILDKPSTAEFVELLASHVCRPVLWRASIDSVVERAPDAVFIEVGPRKVLRDLLNRKWHRNTKMCTDSSKETRSHLNTVIEELRRDVGGE